jgi:16S rRNA (cytidine1402-2'-O)-methyltransferase
MASGLGGQAFSFAGYLPQQPDARLQAARELEQRSARLGETVLMIETPYRNQAIFETLLNALSSETRLLVASALTLPEESIQMAAIADWRAKKAALPKVPTVFGLLAAPAGRKPGGKPGRSR